METSNEQGNTTHEAGLVSMVGQGELQYGDLRKRFYEFMASPRYEKALMLEIPYDTKTKQFAHEPTMALFAKKHGLSRFTLIAWKKRDEYAETVEKHLNQWGKDRTPDVIAALYRRCINMGSAFDVELWLAYVEKWDRKQVVNHVHTRFDADDLRAIIAELPQEEQDKAYVDIGNIITKAEIRRNQTVV